MKLALVLAGAAFALVLADTVYEAEKTLRRLDAIEGERDQWQRPDDVLQALNVKAGDTVIDLGSGSGYFALKLSSSVGPAGNVYAVDIRRLPLIFLWARTISRDQHNIHRVLSTPSSPTLPSGNAQSVLIANTYHELDDRDAILDRVYSSLVPGGRLVVVDPIQTEHGILTLGEVEQQLRNHSFDIVSSNDRFIDEQGRSLWWMIVARR